MRVDLHINFPGNGREALEWYQSVLGGEISLLTDADSPAGKDVPAEWQNKIVHGHVKIRNLEIAVSDVPASQIQTVQGFHLLLQIESETESKRIFRAFSEGGSVTLPLHKTFWSRCYGMVVDKFGISWEINHVD